MDPFADQFMENFNKLYSEKTDPVPRPVDTAKRGKEKGRRRKKKNNNTENSSQKFRKKREG